MKKIDPLMRKMLKKDTNIRLCKKDNYVNMKLELCNYIYNNMSIDKIKNEISCLNFCNFSDNKPLSFFKNIIDVIFATISVLASIVTTYDKNLIDTITSEVIYYMMIIVSFILIFNILDEYRRINNDIHQKYCKLKLECLNKVLNIKLEELNNPKQKTDYNYKHFKVKVSSIK